MEERSRHHAGRQLADVFYPEAHDPYREKRLPGFVGPVLVYATAALSLLVSSACTRTCDVDWRLLERHGGRERLYKLGLWLMRVRRSGRSHQGQRN